MYDIVTFSYLLFPLCLLFLGNKKTDTLSVKLAGYGIICCCFLFFYQNIPKELKGYFQTFYTFFEYIVFTSIFWAILKTKKIRQFMVIASVLFLAFQIFYVVGGHVKKLDSMPIGIETILILIYIISFFFTVSRGTEPIYNHYAFWISVGILIYLGGSFFFFILFQNLSKEEIKAFGELTYVAEILKNILFAMALFIYSRKSFEHQKKNSDSIPFLDMI